MAQAAELGEYAALGAQLPYMLTNLALRSSVYDDCDPPADPVAVGIARGRGQLALETIKLAKKTLDLLFAYMTAHEKPET
ncbi:hypothetical protein [Bradyrhizobium tropiciagri]|uniref:hypothetical protein n=1 Tax=Bradyrhizobium tropiciagri TaxID=312253 RepID=UPI00067DB971|nr:hypothetical protein [Bradyrhizobium tropiciagri]